MCGIAGFEPDGRDTNEIADRLLRSMANRGPDGRWARAVGGIVVVQTRLAVIDLSSRVVYPMTNEAGDLHLAFNGEIYDHAVLRRELEGKGHRFATSCDAEVVLHGYEEWGLDIFQRLNGMFAVGLIDERRGEVVLTRDRFGIKPLVRTTRPPFAFSSDALALVEAGLATGDIDRDAVAEFTVFHYVPPPATALTDIRQIKPGVAFFRRADGTEHEAMWAEIPTPRAVRIGHATAEAADHALKAAVRRQLAADVDVGVFLSGGLDSALILAAAVAAGANPRAFSISFAGHGDYDEAPAATSLARRFEVPHHVDEFRSSFVDAVDAAANACDIPLADASLLPMLQLARNTRSHVKVALSGTGGDDLFGGYYRHRAHLLGRVLARMPKWAAIALRRQAPPQGTARQGGLRLARSYAARLAETIGCSNLDRYLSLVGTGNAAVRTSAFTPEIDRRAALRGVAERFALREPLSPTPFRAIQRFELQTYLPGDLLCKDDRATMAVGLEARVPLLDEALVELAFSLPDDHLVSLRDGKIILRRVARRHRLSVSRLKRGFAVPLGPYLSGPWRSDAREWFRESNSDFVDGAAAASLLDLDAPPATDVWALASLVSWESRVRRARASAPSRSIQLDAPELIAGS